MVDSPEVPHGHPSHTGHRWLDIVLGVSAMFVSVVSLMVALEHGRTMERMADANTRMVEANSWPFVQFNTHNVDEHGSANVRLVLTNEGIGPARIETFELWWDGKPMSSPGALLRSCCLTTPIESEQAKTAIISVGVASPQILRAGEHVDFYAMPENSGNAELWSKLNIERLKITTARLLLLRLRRMLGPRKRTRTASAGSNQSGPPRACEQLSRPGGRLSGERQFFALTHHRDASRFG